MHYDYFKTVKLNICSGTMGKSMKKLSSRAGGGREPQKGSGSKDLQQVLKALAPCVTHVISKPASPTPGSAHCSAAAYDRPPGSLQDVSSLFFVALWETQSSGKCRARPSFLCVCVPFEASPRWRRAMQCTDNPPLPLYLIWNF